MKLTRRTKVQIVVQLSEDEAANFEKVAKKLRTDTVSSTIRAMIEVALRA